METKKTAVYSFGRSHFAEGTSGESYPDVFVPRNGSRGEPVSILYENAITSEKWYDQAVVCESIYVDEPLTTQMRYCQHLESLLETHFERVFLIDACISTLFGVGLLDGISVDVGASQSSMIFCQNGDVVAPLRWTKNDGPSYFNNIYGKHQSMQPQHASFHPLCSPLRDNDGPERYGYAVGTDPSGASESLNFLPDGHAISDDKVLDSFDDGTHKRAFSPDILDDSRAISNVFKPLVEFIADSCEKGMNQYSQKLKCSDLSKHSIVLSGGFGEFPGFVQRCDEEIQRKKLNLSFLNFSCHQEKNMQLKPRILPFRGASILGEYLGQSSYISRKDFSEHGERIVRRKSIFSFPGSV